MTSRADNGSSVRRRHDAQASRQALLEAASALFDERGYDATTIREIGARADVDSALIARYFGGKEGLYLAALAQDGRPSLPTDPFAAFTTMLQRAEEHGNGPVALAMVSPTLTEPMRAQLRELVDGRVLRPLTAELKRRGVGDAALRAEILMALTMGLSLTRTSGTLPRLASAPLPRLLALLEPVVAALQDGGTATA
jgi:AcrR family transcriptional regulator